MEIKLTISDIKTGKSYDKKLEFEQNPYLGKKIGDLLDVDGLNGYEFQITGGSDSAGFPMRADLKGFSKKKILSVASTGIHVNYKGIRVRKTVAGNTIHEKTSQINLKIVKYGNKSINEFFEEKNKSIPTVT
ncbi:MAG TPA: S6e family ribosomal protein [Candidatus Nanoarchaeia archaeon]|nr:S6e family ribosomal protein [Candidatus Nanoarchaeia archaeon]